jgi:hypothetical protein
MIARIRRRLSRIRWPRIRLPQIRRPRIRLPRLRYNPSKGLSGQTLADICNTLSALVGLGAAPALSDAYAWFWASGIAIGVITLGVAAFQWWRARREASPGTWYALSLATVCIGLFTVASNVTAIAMVASNPLDTGIVAGFVGYPAFAAWIAAEGINAYEKLTLKPKTRLSNASLAKSVFQMLGALVVWVFVMLTLKYEAALIVWLLGIGEGLALLGTVLGVLAGLWNLRQKGPRA